MKKSFVIILLLLHGLIAAQQETSGLSRNDTLINILLKKHLLGAYTDYTSIPKQVKGKKIADTLYIYIDDKQKKIALTDLDKRLQNINDSLIYAGFLFNRLQPDSIRIKQQNLHIYYHILKNNQSKIDSLVIVTNKNFPANIRKNLNKSFARKLINLQNIKLVVNFINNNSGYKLTSQPVINFYKEKKLLVLKLQKSQSNRLDGILGFNYDSEKSKLRLEGTINTKFFNLFNTGEQIYLEWQRKDEKQLIRFNTEFPYIRGCNFIFSNFFSSKRQDTTGFSVTNQSRLAYRLKNQSFGFNFTYQFTAENGSEYNNRLAGIYYQNFFITKTRNWSGGIKVRLDLNISEPDKKLLYTQLYANERVRRHIILSHNIRIYTTNQKNLKTLPELQSGMLRKASSIEDEFTAITSFKNELIYRTNHIDFYLIGDYIRRNTLQNSTKVYINTGAGLNFLQKNQILSIEIVKPVYITYDADLQGIYINIKQSLRF